MRGVLGKIAFTKPPRAFFSEKFCFYLKIIGNFGAPGTYRRYSSLVGLKILIYLPNSPLLMKIKLLIATVVATAALSSCAYRTCPTYAKKEVQEIKTESERM